LNLSFVHRSVSNETSCRQNNERLEFLGDSILGAVCATLLYEKFPEKPEGELAKIKSVAVSEEVLSSVARILQIDTMLLLGKGEDLSGGREKKAILADTLEALIGALYLDSGYRAAFDFISRLFTPEIGRITEKDYLRDYKSLLQELRQRRYRAYPQYRLVKRSGPEHERMFWIEVSVNGTVYGPGSGRSKKSAEQEAARAAWQALEGN
jgi:ribonuclease-3